jgi:hypothetical protein
LCASVCGVGALINIWLQFEAPWKALLKQMRPESEPAFRRSGGFQTRSRPYVTVRRLPLLFGISEVTGSPSYIVASGF